MILHAFWYPIFFFLKSVFSVTRIRFRTYGYLLSIFTFAPPNGLSPAIYAFCLGIGVGWIAVAWPSNFSSWLRQKSWSATWAVDNRVFSAFLAGYCSFNNKEKLRQPGTEPLTWGCLASLQSCALPTELSAGVEAFCLIDLFGEAILYGQFMLVHNSVPACCALVVSFLSNTSCFLVSYIFLPEKCFFGHTNSIQDLRISSLNTHLRSSQLTLTSFICFRSRSFGWMNWSCVPKYL